MSGNYPDNFDAAAFDAAHGDETPETDEPSITMCPLPGRMRITIGGKIYYREMLPGHMRWMAEQLLRTARESE